MVIIVWSFPFVYVSLAWVRCFQAKVNLAPPTNPNQTQSQTLYLSISPSVDSMYLFGWLAVCHVCLFVYPPSLARSLARSLSLSLPLSLPPRHSCIGKLHGISLQSVTGTHMHCIYKTTRRDRHTYIHIYIHTYIRTYIHYITSHYFYTRMYIYIHIYIYITLQ